MLRKATAALLFLTLAAGGCKASRPRPPAERIPGTRVVVLVPGWGNVKWWVKPIAEELRDSVDAEVHVCRLSGLGTNKRVPEYARELAAFVAGLKLKPGQRVDLVGYSLGGLVCRWYAEQMRGRVRRIVTVCTPHNGTTKGRKMRSASVRDMQPGSEVLRKLRASPRARADYHSIRLEQDWTVRPSCSAILDGAANYSVPGRFHAAAPFTEKVKRVVRAIYEGRARPNGPQKLTAGQRRELGLAPPPVEP